MKSRCQVFIAKPDYCKPGPCAVLRGVKRVQTHDHTVIAACHIHRGMIANGRILPTVKARR